jgi:PAS domain S-box-containing protein
VQSQSPNNNLESPNLLSLLEDAIEFAVYQIAIDPTHPFGGRVVMVSPSLKEIAGIDDPWRFESWFENIHPDDKPRVIEANRRSWTEHVRYDETARQYNKDKKGWAWVRTISTPAFNVDKQLTHFTGFVLDITEQKQAEGELNYRVEFEKLILSLATNFINLSPNDLELAIGNALQSIGKFTNVDRCYLFSFSKDKQTMACTHEWCSPGVMPQIHNLRKIRVAERPWTNNILLNREILQIPSVNNLPIEAQKEKEEFLRQGIRSLLAVPMVYQGDITGFFGFDSVNNEKNWSEDSVALLQVVASIITNARENKKAQEALKKAYDELEHRVVERTNELKITNESLRAEIDKRKQIEESLQISQALNSEVFYHSPLQLFIVEVLPDRHFRVLRTNPAHQQGSGMLPENVWGKTIEELVIPEVAAAINQHYLDCIEIGHTIEYEETGPSPYWNLERIRTFRTTIAPVFDNHGNVVRLVGSSEDITDQKTAQDILMERAREDAISTERGRLARELHDAVTQTLFSTTLTAEVLPKIFEKNPDAGLKKLDELRELTRGALAEMRTLLMELRPDALADAELQDLLRHLTNAFIARARIPIHLQINGDCTLPVDVKVAFYRIAQESLNNISKHADAEQVTISLACHPASIDLIVEDNGQGFEINQERGTDHYGLRIMHERAEEVNANLEINSQINQGTRVHLRWSGSSTE